jgi:hypothetical protein
MHDSIESITQSIAPESLPIAVAPATKRRIDSLARSGVLAP